MYIAWPPNGVWAFVKLAPMHNGLPGFKKGHPLYLRQNEGQKMDLFYDLSGSARPWGLTKVDISALP